MALSSLCTRPSTSGRVGAGLAGGENLEDKDSRGYPLECLQRRVLFNSEVRPSAGRALDVGPEHGTPLLRGDLFESYSLGATVTQEGSPVGGAQVPDPRHVGAQHRHEIPLP